MARHFVAVGGSKGLGKAFAEAAARAGDAVSIVARNCDDAPERGLFRCDIARDDEAATVLDAIRAARGEIDGIAFFQRFRSGGNAGLADDWCGELQTTLTATKTLIERSLPLFAPAGLKSIVLVSSVNATFISPKLPPGYHLAKAGICQLARYYACTLGPQGIRVNAVCPGTFVKVENQGYYQANPAVAEKLAKASPLGRMGTAREVVDVVQFLLSEKASFVTGQSILVDGGTSLRWQEHLE
jgi:NAD(P)-dependent dehydrogenase (short-subunit alcohol dehydrogenase family)